VYEEALKFVHGASRQEYVDNTSLLGIARALCADYMSLSKHKIEVCTDQTPQTIRQETTGHTPESPWLGPENATLHLERQQLVGSALGGLLSNAQKQCIQLRLIENLTLQQTAQRMGLTVGATKAMQHRATLRLRKALASSR
jgi:RNA polymerase sigma-70 factor (ECF subfamily)